MSRRRRRTKNRRTTDFIRKIVWAIALLTFAVSAGLLLWYGWRSGTEKANNSALQQRIDAAIGQGAQGASQADPKTETEKRLAAYQALAQQNPDMVGWLTIPNTNVNYPVMHTPENPEYYLRRGFDKQYAMSGMLFLDAKCNATTQGDNKIIYGHNMKDKTMLAVVEAYQKQAFCAQNRTLIFDTLTQRYTYEVFAVLRVDTAYENPDALAAYQTLNSASSAQQQAYIDFLKSNRLYDTGVNASPGDTFVLLSTCDNLTDAGRIVLVARRAL